MEEVTTGDDVGHSKPHPEPVEQVLEKAGSGAVFLLGDAPWDGEAAREVGVRFVAVRTGGFSDEVLRDAGAEHVFDDPADLLEHLDEVLG